MSINKFEKWLDKGIKNKWITEVVCDTHEGPELTEEEAKEFDEGGDPCIPVIRVFFD